VFFLLTAPGSGSVGRDVPAQLADNKSQPADSVLKFRRLNSCRMKIVNAEMFSFTDVNHRARKV
jgi:hypothetical protein